MALSLCSYFDGHYPNEPKQQLILKFDGSQYVELDQQHCFCRWEAELSTWNYTTMWFCCFISVFSPEVYYLYNNGFFIVISAFLGNFQKLIVANGMQHAFIPSTLIKSKDWLRPDTFSTYIFILSLEMRFQEDNLKTNLCLFVLLRCKL